MEHPLPLAVDRPRRRRPEHRVHEDHLGVDYRKPWTTGRVYLNYIGDEGHGRIAAAFGPEKYARLTALKNVWDPTNLFRHNQNIPPGD